MAPETLQRISVVTPTLYRAKEVIALLDNLTLQTRPIYELVLVDGAPLNDLETAKVIEDAIGKTPFVINYIRHGGGTAIQRNAGIDAAQGEFIAFIDDDIRLEPDYFDVIMELFQKDIQKKAGGIAGYITNQYLDPQQSIHWKWYRKLKLFTTYEPGKYDYQSGYPINRYTQAPHDGVREIDFMGSNCGVWRREVFATGLRFSDFFKGYGILEDAHLALRARKQWTLLECGKAHCVHLHAKSGREKSRMIARKTAENYRFVFMDIVPDRTFAQEFRFWRVQFFDLIRFFIYAIFHPSKQTWNTVLGKLEGIWYAILMRPEPGKEL